MILKVTFSLLILSLFEDISIEGSVCLPNMKNLAVYEGYDNILMNLITDTNDVKWLSFPSYDEFDDRTIQDNSGNRDSSLTGLFYPNQSGLVIFNATTTPYGGPISTAGLYIAQCVNNENKAGAKLVVVRRAPECSCHASSPTDVQLACTIFYADRTIHPINANITWKIGDVVYTVETPSRTMKDNYLFESRSTITVDNSVSGTFTCTVTFNAPTDIEYPYIATNAPEFSASCSVAGSVCLPNMKNLAVYEGYDKILMNLTTDTNNVKWSCIPSSDEFDERTIQDNNGNRDSSLTGLFYPNRSGLVIFNATTTPYGGPISTAGLYIAQCANNDNRTGAKLVVVRTAPECSCNATSPTDAQLSCTIYYADSTIHPIYANMTWKIGDVVYTTETPSRTRIDYYIFESRSTISVDNSVSGNFTCIVTFNAPTDPVYPFIAKNAPEFGESCSVEVCTITNSQATTITPPITDTSPATKITATTTEILTTTSSPTTVSSYCYPNMKNVAVREGTLDIPMNVTASPCTVTWRVLPTTNELGGNEITRSDCTVDPNLEDLYYVNGSGLTVRNSTTTENGQPITTAGLYIAYCNGNRTGAKLLVVRSGPDCSCSPGSSSSSITLSCSVVFADYYNDAIPAIMTWIVNGAVYTTEMPYKNKTDLYVNTATSTITVDASIVNNYQCILKFGPPEIADDFVSTNAPDFNESCSTPVCVDVNGQTTTPQPTGSTSWPCPGNSTLENIAVYEGDLNILINYRAPPNSVQLRNTATTDELTDAVIVNYDDTVDPSYAADYAYDSSGLTILKATTTVESGHQLSTSGLYYVDCTEPSKTVKYSFKVLVVRQGPTCSCTKVNSASVQVTCSSTYADSSYVPIAAIFTLYVDGNPIASHTPQRTYNDAYTWISTSTFTADYADSSTYQCGQTFGQPALDNDFTVAMNAPKFNQSCSVSAMSCVPARKKRDYGYAQQLLGLPQDPPTTLKSQLVAIEGSRDSGLTTLEIILIVVFGCLLLTVLAFFVWFCRFCSGGKRLRSSQRKDSLDTYGAWNYSFEGRGRLPVPRNRSWTLSSYSFNTHPE